MGDIALLVQDLELKSRKESLLNRLKTLRLYHPVDSFNDEPSYSALLQDQGKWRWTGLRFAIQDHSNHIRRAYDTTGYADKLWARDPGARLRYMVQSGDMELIREDRAAKPEDYLGRSTLEDQAFAKLERVIITGYGDQSWGNFSCDDSLPFDAFPPKSLYHMLTGTPRDHDIRPLPHFLLGLDSVKHYCQTCTGGPFALANEFLHPINTPEIVTYHMNATSSLASLPAIVTGSINRYIFAVTAHIRWGEGNGDVETPEAVASILEPVRAMLFRGDHALCIGGETIDYHPFDEAEVPIQDTFVELYGYSRHVHDSKVVKVGVDHGPSNLKGIQDQLDLVIGDWKGRVVMKNIEEAPPCSACGLGGDAVYQFLGMPMME